MGSDHQWSLDNIIIDFPKKIYNNWDLITYLMYKSNLNYYNKQIIIVQ